MKIDSSIKTGACLMVLACSCLSSSALITNGTINGDNVEDAYLRYGINADGKTLYVSDNLDWPEAGWIGDLEIPEAVDVDGVRMPVTAIGESAFSTHRDVYTNISGTVILPASIIAIGERAFFQNNVSAVVHQHSISFIGSEAFYECVNLSSFRIPEPVKVIQESVFDGCVSLANVEFHHGITNIGGSAFADCDALQNPIFPAELVTIEYGAFSGCDSLTSLKFPAKIKSIDGEAFAECNSLEHVIFPSSLATVGLEAFEPCAKLKTVTFQGEVPGLGRYSEYFNNGDSAEVITIICNPGLGYEEIFSDQSEYRILYATPYAVIKNPKGVTIGNRSTLNFGTVMVGEKGMVRKLRLENAGSKPLRLGKTSLKGKQRNSFAVVSKIPRSVAPGQSTVIKLRFRPEGGKRHSSNLEIKCNDPTKSALKLRLTGTGQV